MIKLEINSEGTFYFQVNTALIYTSFISGIINKTNIPGTYLLIKSLGFSISVILGQSNYAFFETPDLLFCLDVIKRDKAIK